MSSETTWLTQQEAIAHTRLSEDTLIRWVKSGYLIPGVHYGGEGKLRRYDKEMLDCAVRFQTDRDMHDRTIEAKRRFLQPSRRRASS